MTLVPQTDNKLQRHLVSKFRTKNKSAAIQLKFGMVGGIWPLFVPTKFEQNWEQKIPPVFVVAFKTSDERSPLYRNSCTVRFMLLAYSSATWLDLVAHRFTVLWLSSSSVKVSFILL